MIFLVFLRNTVIVTKRWLQARFYLYLFFCYLDLWDTSNMIIPDECQHHFHETSEIQIDSFKSKRSYPILTTIIIPDDIFKWWLFASVLHVALYMELLLEPVLPISSVNSNGVASTQYYCGSLKRAHSLWKWKNSL